MASYNVILTWFAEPDSDGHNVYLNKDGAGFVKENTSLVEEAHFVFEDVPAGSYAAHVTSVRDGEESIPSVSIEFVLDPL